MKLVGRRWARIDEITSPGYVPKLNPKIVQKAQQNQGGNAMTYQSSPQQQQQIQQQLSGMSTMTQQGQLGQQSRQLQNPQMNPYQGISSQQGVPNEPAMSPVLNQMLGAQQGTQMQQMTPNNIGGSAYGYQNGQNYGNPQLQNAIYPPEFFVQPGANYQGMQPQTQMNAYQQVPGMNQQGGGTQNSQNNTGSSRKRSTTSRTGYTHEYLLDNGQIINTTQAYDMAMNGLIEGVMCSSNRGTKYIRMMPDGNVYNNLDDLPEF